MAEIRMAPAALPILERHPWSEPASVPEYPHREPGHLCGRIHITTITGHSLYPGYKFYFCPDYCTTYCLTLDLTRDKCVMELATRKTLIDQA